MPEKVLMLNRMLTCRGFKEEPGNTTYKSIWKRGKETVTRQRLEVGSTVIFNCKKNKMSYILPEEADTIKEVIRECLS